MAGPQASNLIWIDLEMTGLDPEADRIIEIATIVTDAQLQALAEGPVIAVHQSPDRMAALDDWNRRHHGASGLIDRVLASTVDEAQAVAETLDFLRQWVPEGVSPMCGNSICQDRRFLARWMPALESYFHYRNLDVSTLKELGRRWAPEVVAPFRKRATHQALSDIRESIAELQFYRSVLLKI